MRSKRRRRREAERQAGEQRPKAPGVATSIGALLEQAGLNRAGGQRTEEPSAKGATAPAAPKITAGTAAREPAPPASSAAEGGAAGEPQLSTRELALLHQAYVGVEPIRRPARGRIERPTRRAPGSGAPFDPGEEAQARARLSDLVGGGVRFDVTWDEGVVEGLRTGGDRKWLARLTSARFAPEAQLDLHGLRRAEVERAVSQFVRARHRQGLRYLLIIPGKGAHSEGGAGVLGEALAAALSGGSASPLVLAFATAHVRHGGRGAVAVMLK